MPNPFTPNNDEQNDCCRFTFPGLVYEVGHIYIYDIFGICVRKIVVQTGARAKELSRWDGLDENKRSLPQGLYIYVIEVDGEIVCEGTITIAR
ncbi:gliding motility-associated C-terminal domain-containing protein [bacterium]|nr:gliding motility-associated C-terminal domain-containing protein [bacterium]